MGIADIVVYFGGGIAGATITIVIILMIADCIRTAINEDEHMGNWWDE
jgi:hypothetical protein